MAAAFTALVARPCHGQQALLDQLPDNLLLVTWPCGLEPGWEPRGTGKDYQLVPRRASDANPLATEPILKELVGRHRKRLMIVTGLQSCATDPRYIHAQGPTSMWTGWSGAGFSNAAVSALPSIDQRIAAQFETQCLSLHAGVLVGANEFMPVEGLPNYHFGSHGAISINEDPVQLHAVIRDSIVRNRLDLRPLEEERSVLAFLQRDFMRAQSRVAPADRPRLERHLEHIRTIERELVSVACNAPAAPDSGLGGPGGTIGANGVALTRAQANLIAMAFSCQLTKVATLQLGRTDCMYTVPYPGAASPIHVAAHSGVAGAVTRYVSARYMADRLADILDALANVQMNETQTLLDRTLVVMSSEMGDPNHGLSVPIFIAGGSRVFSSSGNVWR